jgi:hypothetical protein
MEVSDHARAAILARVVAALGHPDTQAMEHGGSNEPAGEGADSAIAVLHRLKPGGDKGKKGSGK